MAGQKLKSARAIAVEVLNRCDPKRNYAGPILDGLLHNTDQRQRATDLVFGTLRNRLAIDTVITAFSGRPVRRIQPGLLNIIRIGTYELVHSPATGEHSVVNEAVGNTKAVAGEKQAGFVNAVLRQIIRHISNRRIPLDQAHIKRTLPQTPSTGCEFDTDFLTDNEVTVAGYLGMAFSLPEWLVADWTGEFSEESARQICFASNRRPGIYIRPNLLRTTMDDLAERLRQAGIDLETDADNSMIRIKSPQAITQLPGFMAGDFSVQDITAAQPVRMLIRSTFGVRRSAVRSTQHAARKILDLCAAPGTKTMQLAEATDDSAKIIATDIDAGRLEMVKENIARLGIKSVDVVSYEELPDYRFDCVLLDVPCSNTGVLARRIEARYRINPAKIQGLARLQAGLLDRAAGIVKPNGKICYSTCSIQNIENERLVEDFLQKNKNFTLESERLTLPSVEGFDHDGGYAAILTKIKA